MKIHFFSLILFLLFSSSKQENEERINTFTVGHLTLVDTLGPTRPVDVKVATIKRDETVDFIYKIDSALKYKHDSVRLFNGYFLLGERKDVNDSIQQIEIVTNTLPDWKRKESRTKEKRFLVHTLNSNVIRFDYLDGYTIYRLKSSVLNGGSAQTVKDFEQAHIFIDQIK